MFFRNIHLISGSDRASVAYDSRAHDSGQLGASVTNPCRLIRSRPILFLLVLLNLVFVSTLKAQETQKRSIYSKYSHTRIGEVSADAPFKVVPDARAKAAQKVRVRFIKPTVVGWVSEQYLSIDELTNTATVRADALNFRVGPRVDSAKMTQVYQGHNSLLLDRRSGFAKIYAPNSLEVLIDQGDKPTVVKDTSAELKPIEASTETAKKAARDWALDKSKDASTFQNKVTSQNSSTSQNSKELERVSKQSETTKRAKRQDVYSQTVQAASNLDTGKTLKSDEPELNSVLSEQDGASGLLESKHLLAPGDSISLLVFGEADLSAQNVRVPQSGRVSFPLIGSVAVLGKTTSEVERDVAELLSQGYVRNPRLSISIFSYRPIFIRGEVGSTGDYPYSEGLTIAKAIAIAGGTKESASKEGVSITRDGVVVAEGLSVNSRALVASGDIVSVEADEDVKEAESAYIYLHGEVAQAGAYEFQQGLTVEKAIVLAGGFTLRASKKKIHISRYSDAAEDGAPSELKRVKLYTLIEPGDVIKVGASWF